tara:strand:- start:804 stop:1226 length:423 start_codon:yes stop_codon:yes gene_type:complete
MKKASGFKMKNPSVAKLAKAAGSPMKKDFDIKKIVPQPKKKKLSFDDAYLRRDLNLYGKLSKDEFIKEAKRQKAGGKVPTKPMETKSRPKKIETKKPTATTDTKKTMTPVAESTTTKKKKRESITRRLKRRASKFGRKGT